MAKHYNIPLLRKTMEYIEAHPEEWDQTQWHHNKDKDTGTYCSPRTSRLLAQSDHCGTTMCFAGTAVMLAGYRFMRNSFQCSDPSGKVVQTIPYAAEKELGLTALEAHAIFQYGNNNNYCHDPADFRTFVESVIGEKL